MWGLFNVLCLIFMQHETPKGGLGPISRLYTNIMSLAQQVVLPSKLPTAEWKLYYRESSLYKIKSKWFLCFRVSRRAPLKIFFICFSLLQIQYFHLELKTRHVKKFSLKQLLPPILNFLINTFKIGAKIQSKCQKMFHWKFL